MAVDEVMMYEDHHQRPSSRFLEDPWMRCVSPPHHHHNKRARETAPDDACEHDHHGDEDEMAQQPARKRQRCFTAAGAAAVVVTPPRSLFHYGTTTMDDAWGGNQGTAVEAGWTFSGFPGRQLQPPRIDDSEDDDEKEEQEQYASRRGRLNNFLQSITGQESSDDADSFDDYATDTFVPEADPPMFFPISNRRLRRPLRWGRILLVVISLIMWTTGYLPIPQFFQPTDAAAVDHILRTNGRNTPADLTLREFLLDEEGFSLGMAPAFFGYFGYFGALAAWEEALAADLLQPPRLRQVAGASAGAMAAVLLAAGVSPLRAADFCQRIRLEDFADFPGVLSVFKGHKFEQIMEEYLAQEASIASLLLEHAELPVAVSAFDLQTRAGQILTKGSMARAARASATFPFLFQPVGWTQGDAAYTLIDGGLTDTAGVAGLIGRNPGRVVNLKISPYWGKPPPPSQIPGSTAVVSISIQNLPQPGPWAMELGPIAVKAASQAMKASLDVPLERGSEDNHYELHIDASSFWK